MCPHALFFSEAGAGCVNRNVSSSLGELFHTCEVTQASLALCLGMHVQGYLGLSSSYHSLVLHLAPSLLASTDFCLIL